MTWLALYEDLIYRKGGSLSALVNRHHDISKKLNLRKDCSYSNNLVDRMVFLIKEELHHFCQVLAIMKQRNIEYYHISAERYANQLMRHVRTHEPATLVDKLICGAYIEARSCERFVQLVPYVDEELANFYLSLLRSEARHYQDYLLLAEQVSQEDISQRVNNIGQIEAQSITSPDPEFRFHSGVPV